MRRSIMVAMLAIVALAWPAAAQQPTDAPSASAEHVVLDATFWTFPVPVMDTCITLPAGRVSATLQLVGVRPGQPVEFAFDAYKNHPDPGAMIRVSVTEQPSTVQVPLAGGRYCYAILNTAQAPPGVGTGSAGPIGYDQDVWVRLTIAPQ